MKGNHVSDQHANLTKTDESHEWTPEEKNNHLKTLATAKAAFAAPGEKPTCISSDKAKKQFVKENLPYSGEIKVKTESKNFVNNDNEDFSGIDGSRQLAGDKYDRSSMSHENRQHYSRSRPLNRQMASFSKIYKDHVKYHGEDDSIEYKINIF
ncbi:hypothetical protein K3495_g5164 [Podosphaera aphanis]|nr:hypothetical protein K3495_g5164 [Podosphaera aphanis]